MLSDMSLGDIFNDASRDWMGIYSVMESRRRYVSYNGILQDIWTLFIKFRLGVHIYWSVCIVYTTNISYFLYYLLFISSNRWFVSIIFLNLLFFLFIYRYLAILKPLHLSGIDKRGKIMIFTAWMASCICSSPQVIIFFLNSNICI